MDQVGDFLDVALEQTAGIWVGQHDAGDVGRVLQLAFEVFQVDAPVRGGGVDLVNDEAALRGRGRVGAVRGDGHQHALAMGLAARMKCSANGQHAGEFAVCAGLWSHGNGGHVRQLHQPVGEFLDHFQRACTVDCGCIG